MSVCASCPEALQITLKRSVSSALFRKTYSRRGRYDSGGAWGESISQRDAFSALFQKSRRYLSCPDWSGKVIPVLESQEGQELKVEQWQGSRREGGAKQAVVAGVEGCGLEVQNGGGGGGFLQHTCAPAAGLHIQYKQPEVASRECAEGHKRILWGWRKRGMKYCEQAKGVRRP